MRNNKVLMMTVASLFGMGVVTHASSVYATSPEPLQPAEAITSAEAEVVSNAEYEFPEQEEKHAEVELEKKAKPSKAAQAKTRSKTASPAH